MAAANTNKNVRFAQCPTVEFVDHDFTDEERKALWYIPEYLREQTQRDINLYLRAGTSPVVSRSYCWRGLEHKLMKCSENVQKQRRWYNFLKTFMAFQRDLKELNADVSKLLMVYATKHSQTDRTKAHLVGQQDEAEAFKVYCAEEESIAASTSSNTTRKAKSFSSRSGLAGMKKKTTKKREVNRARSA